MTLYIGEQVGSPGITSQTSMDIVLLYSKANGPTILSMHYKQDWIIKIPVLLYIHTSMTENTMTHFTRVKTTHSKVHNNTKILDLVLIINTTNLYHRNIIT